MYTQNNKQGSTHPPVRTWNHITAALAMATGAQVVDNFHFTDARLREAGCNDHTHWGHWGNCKEMVSQAAVYSVANAICPSSQS